MKLEKRHENDGEGGGAMVEFSILMILFVPLLSYSFYLGDVGHHLLDLQETVISTTWDYTSRTAESDPQNGKSSGDKLDNVYKANRFEYLDHTSSYDDFSSLNSSSDEKKYHYELGSKAAWVSGAGLPPGAGQDLGRGDVASSSYASDYAAASSRQITCATDDQSDLDVFNGNISSSVVRNANPITDFGSSEFARGGIALCWAKLSVYNYVIPDKFTQFAHEDMANSKAEARTTNVETLTSGSSKALVLKDHAAVSFGTWAITDAGDVSYCASATNSFFQRESWMFAGGTLTNVTDLLHISYLNVEGKILSFVNTAKDLELVNPMLASPGTLDGSPAGFGCPAGGMLEAIAGIQASPATAELVARHSTGTKNSGNDIDSSVNAWYPTISDLLLVPGILTPKYESSPGNNGNKNFGDAYKARGPFYMGDTTDKG